MSVYTNSYCDSQVYMYNVVYRMLGNSRILKLLSSDFSCNNIYVVWEYQQKTFTRYIR